MISDTILKRGSVSAQMIARVAAQFGTPLYLYDESLIIEKCQHVLAMPNAFGLEPRYAMKANSNKALLQLISAQGLNIDASSLNEARRAHGAGIPFEKILLTTQEVPLRQDRQDLEKMLLQGLRYNVCSIRQLELVEDFALQHKISLSMRVHPGVGSGESVTRNTGDKYSCFGIHLSGLKTTLARTRAKGLVFDQVHVHIGSGGDPEKWRDNIDRELGFVEEYFPEAKRVNFGGGFKEARMPDESAADIQALGIYAAKRIKEFHERTGRKLVMEVEPGTYIVANSGYLITEVIDKKKTGDDGFGFVIVDGGMEVNARPLLYGSRHPFAVVSQDGNLIGSDCDLSGLTEDKDLRILVGRCCESGDSQTLAADGHIVPRLMAEPNLGDYVVIGGCGAYCASMTPFNYNSHVQAGEVLYRKSDKLQVIRREQSLEQLTANELPLMY